MGKLNRLLDRCDSCHAQAFVRISNGVHDLLLCGHHTSKHEVAFMIQGFVIMEDERSFINTAASASSGVAADDKPDKPNGSTSR